MASTRNGIFALRKSLNLAFSFKHATVESSSFLIQRSYKGSNRYNRMRARKDKLQLEKELEQKYGILSRPEFDRNAWFKRNFFKELDALQTRLGVNFDNNGLLISAFTHPSFIEELKLSSLPQKETDDTDNDDLKNRFKILEKSSELSAEKLAVLGFSVTVETLKEGLYQRYPNISSEICRNLVNKFLLSRETVGKLTKNLGLEEFILLSKELESAKDNFSEESHLEFSKEDVVCDTFFSIIGAITQDLGHAEAKCFAKDFLLTLIDYEDLAKFIELEDPHTELMKILSMHGIDGVTRARTIVESGVNTHFPFFLVGIFINGIKIGEGSSYSAYTARTDAFKNTVFSCIEGEIDFHTLKKTKARR